MWLENQEALYAILRQGELSSPFTSDRIESISRQMKVAVVFNPSTDGLKVQRQQVIGECYKGRSHNEESGGCYSESETHLRVYSKLV